MSFLRILAERLKSIRKLKSKTQQDVANFLNVSRANYGYYETGSQLPPIDKLVLIAEYFQVSLDYLIGNSEQQVVDVLQTIEHILFNLQNNNAVFNGQEMTDTASELIACSLESTITTGKIIERTGLK